MKNLLRVINLAWAWLSIGAALLAIIFLPEAWSERKSEPEDFFLLLVWLLVMAAFAATAWLSHRRFSAAEGDASSGVIFLNLFSACICILGVVLGAFSGQPSSVDMYLLILPALLFALNIVGLRQQTHRLS